MPVTTRSTSGTRSLRPMRPWLVFLVSALLLSSLSTLWAIATPIAASPDEPAHMIKAASVVRGQFNNEDAGSGSLVTVPQYVAYTHAQTCYAFNGEVTADCITAVPGDPSDTVDSTTTAGRYNPVYYLLVGWPTLFVQDSAGVFAMRIVSGVLSSVFLALTVMMISSWKRRAMPMLALGVAVTPMVLFLNGSVNPNTLEITGTLAAFVGVLSVVAHPDRALLVQRAAIVAVSGALAANMRGLSPLWVVVAVLAPLILLRRGDMRALLKPRPVAVAMTAIAASSAFALLWLVLAGSIGAASDLPEDDRPPAPYLGASPIVGFVGMFTRTVDNLHQMIGVFGWLDTPSPTEVYAIWTFLIGSIVVWGVATLRHRPLALALTLLVAAFTLPAIAQAAYITSGGWIWQGRYTLPLLVMLLVGIGALLAPAFSRLNQRTAAILVGLATASILIGHSMAFAGSIQRYAVGLNGSWTAMFGQTAWQPPGGTILVLALYCLALLATAAGAWYVGRDRVTRIA